MDDDSNRNTGARPLTPAARRQSWRELPVRTWMLITLGVLIVVLVVASKNIAQGLRDRRLLRDGVRVEATIENISGMNRNIDRSVSREVNLSFTLPGDADKRELTRVMLTPVQPIGVDAQGERNQPVLLTPAMRMMNRFDRIPLVVDPGDPLRSWTDRVDPAPWTTTLLVPLLLLPAVVVLGLVTSIERKRMLAVYRHGTGRHANVVDIQKSPLAPGQKVLKLSMPGSAVGGRVLAATYPSQLPALERGETIDVIVDDLDKPRRALVAAAYA